MFWLSPERNTFLAYLSPYFDQRRIIIANPVSVIFGCFAFAASLQIAETTLPHRTTYYCLRKWTWSLSIIFKMNAWVMNFANTIVGVGILAVPFCFHVVSTRSMLISFFIFRGVFHNRQKKPMSFRRNYCNIKFEWFKYQQTYYLYFADVKWFIK